MRCNGCGNDNFRLDEISGRYVCTSCWQVSDFFEGMTQNTEEVDGSSYGLRVIDTGVHTNRNGFLHHSVISQSGVFEAHSPVQPVTKEESKQEHNDGGNGANMNAVDSVEVSQVKKSRSEAQRIRSNLRKWRMSEPFTLLLHHQLKEIIRTHLSSESSSPPGIVDRMSSLVKSLWMNYMCITGELGGDMWALAFRRVSAGIRATLSSREDYIRVYNSEGRSCVNQVLPRIGRSGECVDEMVQLSRILESKLGQGFHWAGWGPLYCPNEPQHVNNPFFLFETTFGEEVDDLTVNDEVDETLASCDLGDLDTVGVRESGKRPRRGSGRVSAPSRSPEQESRSETPCKSGDLKHLAHMWKEMIVENLLKKHPKKEVFWHGQLGQFRSNWLLEYNLSVLFLSALLSLTVITEERIPICRHDFLSLYDLMCLCKDRENFPYLAAEKWTTPHFSAYNFNTQMYFKRSQPPDLLILTRITNQLTTMLGIIERPRLPLCSIVHRFLRQLGFPPEAHEIANSLITKLGRCVKSSVTEKGLGMHYLLPLHRYFRGEVFAMAVVVVTARLLFKLNGDYEHRWSNVARFLAETPQAREALEDALGSARDVEMKNRTIPFDWSTWVCNLPRGMPSIRRPRSYCRQSGAPLSSVLSHAQLVRLARSTDEFLGPAASFNPQTDEGWGEKHGTARRHASKEVKLSLTDPISQVVDDLSVVASERVTVQPQAEETPIPLPCKSCTFYSKYCTFFRTSTETEKKSQWTELNCDALVRAARFIHQNKISASEFLAKVSPLTTGRDAIYNDWLYLLENFDSYSPVSELDFSIGLVTNPLSAPYPPPVREFVEDHEQRLFEFMSGKKVNPNSSIRVSLASQESTKKATNRANASIYWFLEAACWICGARMPQLLTEINCIEQLLEFFHDATQSTHVRLKNVALAFHFDYTVFR
uniref:TATA box-binding protein-associated factor RNA polymerase I subunit B n=2 Tax=Mesocestoides corti TaxID=53468 RepID=A0A5K3G392_MESCO